MLVPSISQPQRVLIGAIFVDVLLVTLMLLDARAHRRVHPAWLIGIPLIVAVQWVRVAIQPTQTWIAFADWLARV
jgi:hypothetical protein